MREPPSTSEPFTRSSSSKRPRRRGLVLALFGSLALHVVSLSPAVVLSRSARARRDETQPHETNFELEPTPRGSFPRAPEPTARPTVNPPVTPSVAPSAPPTAAPSAQPSARASASTAPPRNARTREAPADPTLEPEAPSRGVRADRTSDDGLVMRGDPSGIAAQRARLPRAVRCRDAVAGQWRGHSFSARSYNWHVFSLRIERDGDALRGAITVRTWQGGPLQQRPPARCEGDLDYSVRMSAAGEVSGESITFGAQGPATITSARCPTSGFVYNPDHFSGTVDPVRQEFESLNNDGGSSVNDPVLFRRIACLPGDELTVDEGAP